MGLHWDWANDPDWEWQHAVDPLEAADQARKRDKELAGEDGHGRRGDPGCAGAKSLPEARPETLATPASPPSLEWAADLARLTYGREAE